MAVVIKKRRLVSNPRKAAKKRPQPVVKKKSAPKARRPVAKPKRRNPGALMTLGAVNPRRSKSMAQTKKKKSPPKRRRNPVQFGSKKQYRRRRNPSSRTIPPIDLAKGGFVALLGLIATRQVPQMVLGAKNSGWIGYIANLATAAVAAAAASRFVTKAAGQYVLIGGGLYTVSRVLTEQFSPVGKYFALSGVGDAQAAGLGTIKSGYFPVPVVTDARNNPAIPSAIIDAARAAIAPPAAAPAQASAGVGRLSRF